MKPKNPVKRSALVLALALGERFTGPAFAATHDEGPPVGVQFCHAIGTRWAQVGWNSGEHTVDDDAVLDAQHQQVADGHAVHQQGRDLIKPLPPPADTTSPASTGVSFLSSAESQTSRFSTTVAASPSSPGPPLRPWWPRRHHSPASPRAITKNIKRPPLARGGHLYASLDTSSDTNVRFMTFGRFCKNSLVNTLTGTNGRKRHADNSNLFCHLSRFSIYLSLLFMLCFGRLGPFLCAP